MWEAHIQNNPLHKPYNKKSYRHYPRGRVEVSNNRAAVYLNPLLNQSHILDDIKRVFGLRPDTIPSIRIIADNSAHYECHID
jgi:hypothetical protein